jgi:hypothetical protein
MSYRPFSDRVFDLLLDRLSIPPVATGAVLSVALGALALWGTAAAGIVADVAAGLAPDIAVRAPVTLYIMVGYLPMAIYYLGVWTADHTNLVSRQFGLDLGTAKFPRRIANAVGAAGVLTVYLLFLFRPDKPLLLFLPHEWTADFVLPLAGLIFMGWFYFRFMFLLVWFATAISRSARHIQSLDLLDLSAVKPFAQQGVRSSLLAIVSLSISANLWLDPNSPTTATLTTLVLLVAAAVLALFLPTWGIHLRLKAFKHAQLRQLRGAIAMRCDPRDRSLEDAQQLRADLALEQRYNQVSEWPFDAGSYGRVALYVFLGLGSWIGAALVERLLESFGP